MYYIFICVKNIYMNISFIGSECEHFVHNEKGVHAKDNCLICVFNLLHSFNLHSPTYSNLYAAMEYVLTLLAVPH